MHNNFICILKYSVLLFLAFIAIMSPSKVFAQSNVDMIVAQVNDNIILKSEIDLAVADYMRQIRSQNQQIEFTEGLWYNFLESEIDKFVLIEKARIDSIVVEDLEVNNQMDQRISQLVQQAGSEQALEAAFGKSVLQLKAEFREIFREQILTEKVRQQKVSKISITRPEVVEFFNAIPTDSLPTIPEQVAISQIVAVPPAKTDAKKDAFELAEALRDSIINHGRTIEELARKYGMDGTASRGGLLPLMNINDLVPEYSAAASALQPGQISEVVETQFGFHVIKLVRRVGDQIETNHILISVREDQLDEQVALDKLNSIRDSLISNPDLSFSDLAKSNSEDESTAIYGGKVLDPQTGERLIPLTRLDAALYRTVLLMDEVGTISQPRSFTLDNSNRGKAFRIIRLDQQIPEHVANLKQDYERIKRIALQQKQADIYNSWLEELRSEIYVEYRIPKFESL